MKASQTWLYVAALVVFTAAAAVINNIIPSAAAARLEEVLRNYLDQARAPLPQEKSQRE